MADKITIKIDVELCDIVPPYLANRKAEMPVIRNALSQSDFETLAAIGHRIKGSAGGYGFNYLGTLGALIEVGAQEHDAKKVEHAIKEMETYLNHVHVVYEKMAG